MWFFKKRNPWKIESINAESLSVFLFYLSFSIYIVASIVSYTTIKYDYKNVYHILLNICWVCVLFSILNILFLTDYSLGQLLIYMILFLILFISSYQSNNETLFQSFCIVLSARYVKWESFIKQTCILYLFTLLGTFLLYATGITRCMGYTKPELTDVTLTDLGFSHPNNLALYLLTFSLIWVAARYSALKIYDYLLLLAITAFIYFKCCSRTSAYLLCLMILMIILMKKFGERLIRTVPGKLLFLSFGPGCFLFTFFTDYLYDENSTFFLKLDDALSGRISLGYLFLEKYRHTWLGQRIKMIGSVTAGKTGKTYFYLDSAYMRLYIGIGILGTIIAFALITAVIYYALQTNRQEILICMVILLLEAISESYLVVLSYNPFLILLACITFTKYGNTISTCRDPAIPIQRIGSTGIYI